MATSFEVVTELGLRGRCLHRSTVVVLSELENFEGRYFFSTLFPRFSCVGQPSGTNTDGILECW